MYDVKSKKFLCAFLFYLYGRTYWILSVEIIVWKAEIQFSNRQYLQNLSLDIEKP